jgi:hypothetical protein
LKIRKKGRYIKMDENRNKQVEDILKTLQEEERKKKERKELLEKRKQRKRELEKIYVKKYFDIPENLERHKEYCRQYYIKNKERILRNRAERSKIEKQREKQLRQKYKKKYFSIEENKERHKEHCRKWYDKNKESIKEKRKEKNIKKEELIKENFEVWSKIEWDKYNSI